MNSELSTREMLVLKAISSGLRDPKAISEAQGIPVESVISIADGLAENGLVNVTKSVSEVFSLNEEGQRYAKDGLPERQLLDFAKDGIALSAIKDPSLKIGIGWLRKKGWASIESGMLRPLKTATLGPDEIVISTLYEKPTASDDLDAKGLSELKSRGLVVSSTVKSWSFEITVDGRGLCETKGDVPSKEVVQITPEMIKYGEWDGSVVTYKGERYSVKRYEVSLESEKSYPGKSHPYQRMIDWMRSIMLDMGFTEIRGGVVQSSFWNFDALFQPQDHPAREMQDTFYLDSKAEIPDFSKVKEMHERGGTIGSSGWGGVWNEDVARQEVLRTHTTSISIRYLAEHPKPPVKAFCIDRAYRREAIDSTHTPEFEQLEGIVMDKDVTFSNLLGILKEFYVKMGFEEVRFRPGYFPYTEPSVEPEVWVDGLGWVELGGAGVFRREVTAPFGIDYPVLAWGLGVSRVAMLTLKLKDLRLLYQSDIGWLREVPVSLTGLRC